MELESASAEWQAASWMEQAAVAVTAFRLAWEAGDRIAV
jgi:hypothetical protein